MRIEKKNLMLVAILSLFVLVLLIISINNLRQNQSDRNFVSLADAVKELDYCYRLLKFPFPENQPETAVEKITRTYSAWNIFINSFGGYQPPEFKRTREWPEKILAIKKYAKKANELALEKQEQIAIAEMEKAYQIFYQIKKDNNFSDFFNEIMLFYQSSRKISLTEEKLKSSDLTDLKLLFTGLKKQIVKDENQILFARLELAIMDIERLLPGPDYKKAQKDLLAGAEELYWRF